MANCPPEFDRAIEVEDSPRSKSDVDYNELEKELTQLEIDAQTYAAIKAEKERIDFILLQKQREYELEGFEGAVWFD